MVSFPLGSIHHHLPMYCPWLINTDLYTLSSQGSLPQAGVSSLGGAVWCSVRHDGGPMASQLCLTDAARPGICTPLGACCSRHSNYSLPLWSSASFSPRHRIGQGVRFLPPRVWWVFLQPPPSRVWWVFLQPPPSRVISAHIRFNCIPAFHPSPAILFCLAFSHLNLLFKTTPLEFLSPTRWPLCLTDTSL